MYPKYKKTKRYLPKKSNNSEPWYYAYHDIDANKEQILGQIAYWHVENCKYIIPNNNVKKGEINYPGFDKSKVIINGKEFVVNNEENFVNEFGIAMNPEDCQEFKYSIVEVK